MVLHTATLSKSFELGETHHVCALRQVSLPTQYNGKNQDPVGALSSALARLQASKPLRELREVAKVSSRK